MRQALPDIQVELVASNDVSNLLRREADIALRMVQPDQSSLVAHGASAPSHWAHMHTRITCAAGAFRASPPTCWRTSWWATTATRTSCAALPPWGYPVERASQFALRTDDFIAYWQAVRAGLGIGFVAHYMARTDPEVLPVLPALALPSLPIWAHGAPRDPHQRAHPRGV